MTLPYEVSPNEVSSSYLGINTVWQGVFALITVYTLMSILLFIAFDILRINIPVLFRPFAHLSITTLPLLLWLFIVYRPLKRTQLGLTCIVAMLTANAVGIPLFNMLFSADTWLATQTTTNRIIGYTVTFGVLHIFLQYIVLRYLAWQSVETDDDAVLYAVAVAVGYATVMNLNLLDEPMTTGSLSGRAFSMFALFVANNLFLSYGLARVQLDNALFVLMPMMLVFTSGFAGLAMTIRSGIQNASFAVAVTTPRPLFGLVFSIILIVGASAVVYFFFNRIAIQRMLANDDT